MSQCKPGLSFFYAYAYAYACVASEDRAFLKPYHIAKKWKIWNILCLQASNLAPKVVVRRTSPSSRIIVVLFWTKCAVRRQIKPGILLLSIKRG